MTSPTIIASPKSESELLARDSLLTQTLRSQPLDWGYSTEYPLVMSPLVADLSQCIYIDGELAAHATLFKRTLQHASGSSNFTLGLVGNVATSAKFRGQGLQRQLTDHVEKIALMQNIDALVLWSDLLEFYQKLGFRSIGQELRFRFQRRVDFKQTSVKLVNARNFTSESFHELQHLRPRLEWSLERSSEEFAKLLTIPDTFLFLNKSGSRVKSYYIMGKGSDMQGVIHEWGVFNDSLINQDIQTILAAHKLDELTFLTPSTLASSTLQVLKTWSSGHTSHPMALAKPIGDRGQFVLKALAKGFIWGLDSI